MVYARASQEKNSSENEYTSTHDHTYARARRQHARTHARTYKGTVAEPSIIIGFASAAIFLAALDSHTCMREVAKGLLSRRTEEESLHAILARRYARR